MRNSTHRSLCKASIYTISKTVHFHRQKDTLSVQMYTFTKVCQQTLISHSALSTMVDFRFNNLLQRMQQEDRLSLPTEVHFLCHFSCYTSPPALMVKLNLPLCLINHHTMKTQWGTGDTVPCTRLRKGSPSCLGCISLLTTKKRVW